MDLLDGVGTNAKERKDAQLQMQQQQANEKPAHDEADEDPLDPPQNDKQRSQESLRAYLASIAPSDGVPLLGSENDTAKPLSKYVQLKLLGNGAYGEAYLCKERGQQNPTQQQMVVAKTMNIPNMSNKELLYAQSEIQCLSSVRHTNIVRFIASECSEKQLVIVMEFADAGDLRRHIKTRGATKSYLSESEAMLLFLQIVMAVEHIHANSMLHRDLKTANVLISSSGLVKLADFGFSRRYEGTVSGQVAKTFCGTPYYLAPEIWANRRYSNKAEVWSLGVLLYELLSLNRPFTANSIKGLMEQVCAGKYPPLPNTYSRQAHDLVATLLNLDPARRPTTTEIFMIPYVAQQLDTLIQLVAENPHVTEKVKAEWRAEAVGLKEKVAAHAARRGTMSMTASIETAAARNEVERRNAQAIANSVPGCTNNAISYESPVYKLTTAVKHSWSEKYLVLEGGQLHLCEASGRMEGRRSLPVESLLTVTKIPETVSKRPFVFAIHTKDSKCTWLQAYSEAEHNAWVKWISAAMGIIA